MKIKIFNPFNFFKRKKSLISSSSKEIPADCGHRTLLKGSITSMKETRELKISLVENGKTPFCLSCLEKMSVVCPWCRRPIFIGDHITLYTPKDENFQIPEGAVVYSPEPLVLVGCPRGDCADTGADYSGYWYPPGKVLREPSMIELSMQSLQNGGSGIVIRNGNNTKIR